MSQSQERLRDLILPGEAGARDDFNHYKVINVEGHPHPIAMVKFPKSLERPWKKALDENENVMVLWFMTHRRDEESEDSGLKTSRYELRGFLKNLDETVPEGMTPAEYLEGKLAHATQQDGYIYLPKDLRDGRHGDHYILQPIEEQEFRTRTERGMFEEVCWSPFGTVDSAVEAEATNLERNPLMRNWK